MKGFQEGNTNSSNRNNNILGSVSSEAEPSIGHYKHQKSAALWPGIWPPAISIFGNLSSSHNKSEFKNCSHSSTIKKKSVSGKNYYEGLRGAVRRVMMNGGSMRRILGFNKTNISTSKSDIWLLGVCYHVAQEGDDSSDPTQSEGFTAFVEDFSSRILITYRKGFSPIGDSKYSSDVNWGCMLRSSQMLVAQAFLVHKLGRSWRKSPHMPLDQSYTEILHLFGDAEDSPFSIHNLLEAGKAYGLAPGSWVGPYAMCRTWESLVRNKREETDAGVLSSMMALYVVSGDEDGERGGAPVLCIEDISRNCSEFSRSQVNWPPILLLVPLVLGLEKVNPRYLPLLCATFTFPQSLGILGGKPGASTYIVGVQDEKAFYLDPHEVQQVMVAGIMDLANRAKLANELTDRTDMDVDWWILLGFSHIAGERDAVDPFCRLASGLWVIPENNHFSCTVISWDVRILAPNYKIEIQEEKMVDIKTNNIDTDTSSYHCNIVRHIALDSIDSSLAIGFYCKDKSDFDDLCRRALELVDQSDGAPLFTVAETRSSRILGAKSSDIQDCESENSAHEDDWQLL